MSIWEDALVLLAKKRIVQINLVIILLKCCYFREKDRLLMELMCFCFRKKSELNQERS